jgi:Mg2+ and Co2+ transporter CorA
MTVIAARHYREGKILSDIDLAKPIPHVEKPSDFIWIGLHDPDDGALKRIQEHFGLHPLAVEDALDPRHLPRWSFMAIICFWWRAPHICMATELNMATPRSLSGGSL